MKKITYILVISLCIIVCFILLYLSINNLNKKYDKYGYEISNWKIYKLNLEIEKEKFKAISGILIPITAVLEIINLMEYKNINKTMKKNRN